MSDFPSSERKLVSVPVKEESESEDDCFSDEESFEDCDLESDMNTLMIKAKERELSVKEKKKRDKSATGKTYTKTNVNVFGVAFSNLEEEASDITGDPVLCKRCGVILSSISKLEDIPEDSSTIQSEPADIWKAPAIHPKIEEFSEPLTLQDDGSKLWRCEFCDEVNIVDLDIEEMPVADTVDYLLEHPPEVDEDGDTSNVIFCIGKFHLKEKTK